MEKRKILWTLITGAAVSIVIIAGSMTYAVRQQGGAEEIAVTEPVTEAGYLLRIHDQKLALFRTGSSVPYQYVDMPLNLLSEYDYQQLLTGVTAATEAELRRLLEDYTS